MKTAHKGSLFACCVVVGIALAAVLGSGLSVVRAAAITVTNPNDSGAGSLRQAIADAAPGDTIVFDGSLAGQTITLAAQLEITKNLAIDGSGLSAPVTVSGDTGGDGSPDVRVFQVTNNAHVTLSNLTIARGHGDVGGGISIGAGATVTLTHSAILSSTANHGGGIYNDGALMVQNSTLAGNSVPYNGGGIYNYQGTLAMQNSTFSGNSASSGGGIYNYQGTLTMQNSTLSGNSASSGGGIYSSGTLNYQNTLVANSPSGGDCANSGTIGVNVRNLVEDGSCSPALSGDPLLGPLADNGGDTLTHALLYGSPALEAADDATCLPTDQRGVPRPQGSHCDVGAVEKIWSLHLTKTVTPTTDVAYHGMVTYTLVLENVGGAPDPSVWLTDTLPAEVDFSSWVISPTNTTLDGGEIRWHDALDAGRAVTFTFRAMHTGLYRDRVVNLAHFSGTLDVGSEQAAFDVECGPSYTVQNANDSGSGSLRQAIVNVCPGGVITFSGDTTIHLSSPLVITQNLSIDGNSHAVTVSGDTGGDGSPDVRVFKVTNDAHATLSNLTIVHGKDTSTECNDDSCGGGIKIDAGATVTLTHSAILSNTAHSGGGIYNDGALMVQYCTLSGNSAGWDGGGILNNGTTVVTNSTLSGNSASFGGGIRNSAVLTLQNCTLSGSLVTYDGGGVYNNGTLTAQNNTLSSNSASRTGGGIYNSGTLNYQNTLVANSPSGGDCANSGTIGVNVRNLVEDGSCSPALSGDPLLGPLADNGGDTLTHALLYGSPALEAADDATCLPTDQRGVPRPQGSHCDVGAVEKIWSLHLTKTVTPTTDVAYHGMVTYTLVLENVGGAPDPNAWLTDTLPAEVDFSSWVISPTNTTLDGGEIRWHDALDAGQAVTFTFRAMHTGLYRDRVVNLAHFSSTLDVDSAQAAFDVECSPSYTVQNANDSGSGSLRQAIAGVCPGGVITFSGDTTIHLSSPLVIPQNLSIDGGSRAVTVSGDTGGDGSPDVRVFQVTNDAHVTLSNLTIAHGKDTSTECNDHSCGGGIKVDAGATVTLTHSAILSSTAHSGGGIYNDGALMVQNSTLVGNSASSGGGGILNYGALTVENSTLSGNSADSSGGGIYNDGALMVQNSTLVGNSASGGGGIHNYGALTVENSTLSGNSAGRHGGGIHNFDVATVHHSTFSGNSASSGGGIYNCSISPGGVGILYYRNTLIANSLSGGDCANDGTIGANVGNLVQDGSCSPVLSGDPLLGPLADNGGDTLTHALLTGSPALETADAGACLPTDQRGVPRPQQTYCDIGAFELGVVDLSLAKSVAPDIDVAYHGVVTYTLVLSNTGFSDDYVTLTDALPPGVAFGQWLALPAGSLVQNGNAFTWEGIVALQSHPTFIFTATHTGGYGETIVNIAFYNGTLQAGSSTATFTVEPDAPPEAVDDAYTTPQDTPLMVLDPATQGVLANDSDPDGDPLTAALLAQPAHGVVALASAGTFIYVPDAGFIGVDVFNYTASDGELSDTALVTITVTPVNKAPVALDNIGVTREDQVLVAPAPGVLANDSDPNGDPLAVELVTAPLTGSVQLAANGAYTYTPEPDFNDVVTFTYRAHDTGVLSSTAMVYILVQAVNDGPTFVRGADQIVYENSGAQTVTGWATAISPGPPDESWQTLTFSATNTHPALFAVQPALDASGTLRYTPAANARGTALVTVTLYDSGGTAYGGVNSSAPQTFGITIAPQLTYTLNVAVVGQGTVAPPGGVYTAGTHVTLKAAPDTDWHFAGWTGAALGMANPVSITMDGDKVVTATFTQEPVVTYTLTVHVVGQGTVVVGQGTVAPSGGEYVSGTLLSLQATPDAGWRFAGWTGAVVGMANPISLTMDGDKVVTATFSQMPVVAYTLTVHVMGQGSVVPPGGVYTAGTHVTLTATPDAGWHFGQWSGDASGVLTQTTVLMNADRVVTATFVSTPPAYYTLTMGLVGSGVITPGVGAHPYLAGTEVELSATPSPGWSFDGWSGATLLMNPTRIVMSAHKTMTATFTPLPNRPPSANAGGDQTVAPGTTVILDGSTSTDLDGDVLIYFWQQTGGTGVSFTPTLSRTTFTAPSAGVLTFTLTVTDTGGLSNADEVAITVTAHRIYLPLALKS